MNVLAAFKYAYRRWRLERAHARHRAFMRTLEEARKVVLSLLPPPFNWEREYGPLWTGSDCTAFWLAPGPDDVMDVNGVRATKAEHDAGAFNRHTPTAEANRFYDDSMGAYVYVSGTTWFRARPRRTEDGNTY